MPEYSKNQKSIFFILLVCLLTFTAVFLLWVRQHSVNILFSDQWHTFTPLFDQHSIWQTFTRQHGPHRLGIGFVISAELMKLSNWNVAYESYFAALTLVATALIALLLKYRVCLSFALSDLAIIALILSPLHYETVLLVPSTYHSILPLLLTFAIALTLLAQSDFLRFIVGSLLAFAAIFSGFGMIPAALITVFYFISFLHRLKNASFKSCLYPALSLLILTLSWLLFFYEYRFDSGAGELSPNTFLPLAYVKYVSLMLAGVLQISGQHAFWVGAVLLALSLAIAAYLILKQSKESTGIENSVKIQLFLILSTLAYAMLTAAGRLQLGDMHSQSSRYMAMIVPLYFAIYLFISKHFELKTRTALQVVYALIILSRLTTLSVHHRDTLYGFQQAKRNWIAAYLEVKDLDLANNKSGFQLHAATKERLDYLEANKLSFFANSNK